MPIDGKNRARDVSIGQSCRLAVSRFVCLKADDLVGRELGRDGSVSLIWSSSWLEKTMLVHVFKRWINEFFGGTAEQTVRTKRPIELHLDLMEDRIVPANYVVTSLNEGAGAVVTSGGGIDGSPDHPFQASTLRAAINAANAVGDADTIVFQASLFASGATINLSTVGDDTAGPSAFGIDTDVTILGWAGYGITLAGNGSLRQFYVAPTGNLTLQNLTLSGGKSQGGGSGAGGGGAGMGGAIFNQGRLKLVSSTLSGNTALGGDGLGFAFANGLYGGGGLGNGGANTANGDGPNGGTYSGGAGGFGGGGAKGGTFVSNAGNGGFGGGGGGTAYHGSLGGVGGFGGGGGMGFQTDLNKPGGFGGGAAFDRFPYAGGGGAGMGGAIFNAAGTVTITNSTLAGNTAKGGGGASVSTNRSGNGSGFGGAIFNLNGSVTINHATLASNTVSAGSGGIGGSADGGALYTLGMDNVFVSGDGAGATVGTAAGAKLLAINSLFANSIGGADITGSATAIDGASIDNLFTSGSYVGPSPQFTSTDTASLALGSLADNGGPTMTIAIGPSSSAYGGGDNTAAASAGVTTDQRSVARPFDANVDVGAFEYSPLVLVAYNASTDTLTITGLSGAANDITVSAPVDNSVQIDLNGGYATFLLNGAAAADTTNFVVSNGGTRLTINTGNAPAAAFDVGLGSAADTLKFSLAAATGVQDVSITTGAGDDIVTFDGNVNITGHLQATGGAVAVDSSVQIKTNGGDITFVGEGNASRSIGINVNAASLDAGGGDISLTGTGFGAGSNLGGVVIRDGALVSTTLAGDITITGSASASGTGSSAGVSIEGNGATVAGDRGNITITGQGAGSGNDNVGVRIKGDGFVKVTGSGAAVVITGSGSASGGDGNVGVHMTGGHVLAGSAGSVVTGSGGVSMTGSGGGSSPTSKGNDGILLEQGALVATQNSGKLTVLGTAGAGPGGAASNVPDTASIRLDQINFKATGGASISIDPGASGIVFTQATLSFKADETFLERGMLRNSAAIFDGTPLTIKSGATLENDGNIMSHVFINDGAILSGAISTTVPSPSAGQMSDLTLDSGATVKFLVSGAPNSAHSRFLIDHTGDLGGATAELTGSITSNLGQVVALFEMDSNTVTGEFDGRPEGSIVAINGIDFTLFYKGGASGRDVVLQQLLRPVFAGVTSKVISAGTASFNFSGTLMAGSTPATGTVTVTISGNGIPPIVASGTLSAGAFTIPVDVSGLQASATPYTVTYGYATQSTFYAASDAGTSARVASANEIYVRALYKDLLLRTGDEAGIAGWVKLLDQGGSQESVALGMTRSAEYFATVVIAPAYRQLLGREADPAGLAAWIPLLTSGMTVEQFESNVLASPEFSTNAGGTDAAWLDAVYRKLLGRAPDTAGFDTWMSQLALGASRDQAALGIAASSEHVQQHISADYIAYLKRSPDPNGLADWTSFIVTRHHTNEDVIAKLLSSAEYVGAIPSRDPLALFR